MVPFLQPCRVLLQMRPLLLGLVLLAFFEARLREQAFAESAEQEERDRGVLRVGFISDFSGAFAKSAKTFQEGFHNFVATELN